MRGKHTHTHTHTHSEVASVNEWSEEGEMYKGEREKEEETERAGPWMETQRASVSWETEGRPQSPHWVCVGDDVSVKYKSEDRYENKSHRRPRCM